MPELLEQIVVDTAEMVRPPERLTVSQAAVKYRKLNNPGSYVGDWDNSIAPYMVEPMDELTSLDYTGMIFVGPARCGKALALDTPIATPSGWTTMGALNVGEQVFSDTGAVCSVIAATPVMRDHDCYEIEFNDGEKIVADAGHRWAVNDCHRPQAVRIITTADMAATYCFGKDARSRYSVTAIGKLVLPDAQLPVDPYVLGAWLGDGHSSGARIFSGSDDAPHMNANLLLCGVDTRVARRADGNATITLSAKAHRPGRGGKAAGVSAALRSLGMSQYGQPKYIPVQYLRASIKQRMELLQGLMDTDGHVEARGRCEFCTTAPGLADGFADLLSGLGYKFHRYTKPAADKIAYRFFFYPPRHDRVFALQRKQSRLRNYGARSIQNDRRQIVSVRKVKSVPVRCIQVDSPSSLFLAGAKMIPTHNSDIYFNWLAHTAICDPADMMVVHMTQNTARDWSKGDLQKVFRHSPDIGAKVKPGRQSLNTHDIDFVSGMRLLVKWPTITELSGKTIPRLFLMDYDRMPLDVDKEGTPFDLARKRTTTFRRYGMTVAESSPGWQVENPKWLATTPHEAPPTPGILALFNRGDRRRWYWRCLDCKEAFEPTFACLNYPDSTDKMEAAEMATLRCPLCQFDHQHEQKQELNYRGRWIKDRMKWLPDGSVAGDPIRSSIASFWLKGPAAAFADWKLLVLNYLSAFEEFEKTGSEEALKTTVNTDQGEPYVPQGAEGERLPEDLKSRAYDFGERVVPDGVRFLIATIDVQKNRFVVQVHGIGEHGDIWIIDRFDVRKSERKDDDGERFWISPGSYEEDWRLLVDAVILKTYPLADGSGRRMSIKAVGCDSGGREGVTANAYKFWRWLKTKHPGNLHRRFQLVKGSPLKAIPRVQISYPDAERKDRRAGAMGEVPILIINSNQVKDQVNKLLDREAIGGGRISFPDWLPDTFYTELTVEVRTTKGWENPKNLRNESWDLLCYCIAINLSRHVNIERINWLKPPSWAAEWDKNDLIVSECLSPRFDSQLKGDIGLERLGAELA